MNLVLLEPSDFSGGNGNRVLLTGRRMEHLRRVCRVATGERVRVGLLNGPLGTATITAIASDTIEMETALCESPPPPLSITLIIAMPRPKSLKKSIETAASLGVKKIVVIGSWRVEKSYWSSLVLSEESLSRHLKLGLEQARDTVLPSIELRRRFKPFIEDELPGIVSGINRRFVAHPYDARPCPSAIGEPAVLIIGPEGGFIPYEIARFEETGFMPVTIGNRILRVETAVAAFIGRLW